jgi:hypothetical protein
MKSPGFKVETTISGDFINHKTKYKAINSICYSFSEATKYLDTAVNPSWQSWHL